jgi:hypothetical protein
VRIHEYPLAVGPTVNYPALLLMLLFCSNGRPMLIMVPTNLRKLPLIVYVKT